MVWGKHVVINLFNSPVQSLLEKYNLAGSLDNTSADYLNVNVSLLPGAHERANLQALVVKSGLEENGQVSSKLKITLKTSGQNPTQQKLLLQIYVPKDSALLGYQGVNNTIASASDSGKTVFLAEAIVRGGSETPLTLEYHSPVSVPAGQGYQILLQKQIGSENFDYEVGWDGKTNRVNLNRDTLLTFEP